MSELPSKSRADVGVWRVGHRLVSGCQHSGQSRRRNRHQQGHVHAMKSLHRSRLRLQVVLALGVATTLLVAACGEVVEGQKCPSGKLPCQGVCVNTLTDPHNCGVCGVACELASLCSHGACASVCGQAESACDVDGGGFCTNLKGDNLNCGACGSACKNLEACVSGKCEQGCSQGQTACMPEAGAPLCVAIQTDNLNCGACGNACGAQKVCVQGACVSQCAAGQITCAPDGGAPYCAKADTDNLNCGGCGVACGELQVCAGGKCAAVCLSTQTKCAAPDGGVSGDGGPLPAYCTDVTTDNANCGACGVLCPFAKALCSSGTCISPG